MDPNQVIRDEAGVMKCRECGFAYNLTPHEINSRATDGLAAVRAALAAVPVEHRFLRPSPDVAHLADASRVIIWRVKTIAEQEDPPLPNHDQDRAVEDSHADNRLSSESMEELARAVEEFRQYTDHMPAEAWGRTGIHSVAGRVKLADIAHDMGHELEHHAADIRQVGEKVQR